MNINIIDGRDNSIVSRAALVCRDGFALTGSGEWLAVNHVKSGIAILCVRSRFDGEVVISVLAEMEIAGVNLAAMPGCEICANALWIKAELVKTLDETGLYPCINRESKTNANAIADILECAMTP